MSNATLDVEDVLTDLLEAEEVTSLADLEIDTTEAITAKASAWRTIAYHC